MCHTVKYCVQLKVPANLVAMCQAQVAAGAPHCTSLPHAPQTAAADKHAGHTPSCLQRARASSATTHVMLEQLDALRMLQGVLTSDLLTEQLCTNMSPLLTRQGTERGSITTWKF